LVEEESKEEEQDPDHSKMPVYGISYEDNYHNKGLIRMKLGIFSLPYNDMYLDDFLDFAKGYGDEEVEITATRIAIISISMMSLLGELKKFLMRSNQEG
jgi:hypothetical protein